MAVMLVLVTAVIFAGSQFAEKGTFHEAPLSALSSILTTRRKKSDVSGK